MNERYNDARQSGELVNPALLENCNSNYETTTKIDRTTTEFTRCQASKAISQKINKEDELELCTVTGLSTSMLGKPLRLPNSGESDRSSKKMK